MKTSAMMRCPKCEETSELDNLHLLDHSFKREWVGLTDEEIKPCWHEACQTDLELTSQLVVYFAKAIEAKLKEKNSA